jgi:hypothetical protein
MEAVAQRVPASDASQYGDKAKPCQCGHKGICSCSTLYRKRQCQLFNHDSPLTQDDNVHSCGPSSKVVIRPKADVAFIVTKLVVVILTATMGTNAAVLPTGVLLGKRPVYHLSRVSCADTNAAHDAEVDLFQLDDKLVNLRHKLLATGMRNMIDYFR